jgi:uncharacterized membrane protein YfcA
MSNIASYALLSAAVFSGGLISGLAGFAFSAVAGAILLHILPPIEAVPLMMACSLPVQAATLWMLRRNVQWKSSFVLIVGGLLGIPPAVYLLQNVDTWLFRIGFGVLVAAYAAYMLFRPALAAFRWTGCRVRNGLIGFGGGLIGGLTAMPGALPTIWCDLHGMPKNELRGLVQPFIMVMQIFALVLILGRYDLSSKFLLDLTISLPALAAGTALGFFMFRSVNEAVFRRVILVVLFFSGLSLVV